MRYILKLKTTASEKQNVIKFQTADIAAAQLTVTSNRAKVLEFTHPFMTSGLKILYKPPSPWANGEPLTVLLTPFTPATWFMIVLVFVGIALSFYAIGRLSPYEDCSFVGKASTYEGLTLFNSMLYAYSSLTWQGKLIVISISTFLFWARDFNNRIENKLINLE